MGRVKLSAEECVQRGLDPLDISVDAEGAGLMARPFPDKGVYLILNGPPGAPLDVLIWRREQPDRDLAADVREFLVPNWVKLLEHAGPDEARVLGAMRSGILFTTDAGIARTAWFAFGVEIGNKHIVVMLGVDGRDGRPFSATDVLANRVVASAMASLRIDSRDMAAPA